MKAEWVTSSKDFEYYILAGDIGGTNTNLAIVGKKGQGFSLVLKMNFDSHSQQSLSEPIALTLKEAGGDRAPRFCCISAAGPVDNNLCRLTNLSWEIDGEATSREFDFPVLVINDFEALSYGVPLLDVNNTQLVTRIPAANGSFPEPRGNVSALVGAGTGLGVGCVMQEGQSLKVLASEGGHIDFAAFDAESREMVDYLQTKTGRAPDAESLVSGGGLANILDFMLDTGRIQAAGEIAEIGKRERRDRPPLIAAGAASNPDLQKVMRLFVRCYARVASTFALSFLCRNGLFLAGGIAAKNEQHFLKDNCFIEAFSINMRQSFSELLESIPVYIVRDYDTSLLGAANAGDQLLQYQLLQ